MTILKDLGIANPHEIDRYSLQTVGKIDILRVVYKRKKGSFLPDSKKFRFERRELMSSSDGAINYEVAPVVRQVMQELDPIIKSKHDQRRHLELLEEEISRLEEEHLHRIAYIKSLLAELKNK